MWHILKERDTVKLLLRKADAVLHTANCENTLRWVKFYFLLLESFEGIHIYTKILHRETVLRLVVIA